MKDEIRESLSYDLAVARIKELEQENENLKEYLKIMEKAKDNNLNRFLDYLTNIEQENERLKKQLNCKEVYSNYMPEGIDFIILSKADYDRQQEDIELNAIELKSRIDKVYKITTDFENWLQDSDLIARATVIDLICDIQKALTGGDEE